MSKTFWGFFAVALAIVGVAVSFVWFGNVSSHLVLKGTILTVRAVDTSDGGSIGVVDFRLKNPTNVPFVVKQVELTVDPASGDAPKSFLISKSDVGAVFEVHPDIGPKFHDVLSLQDKIGPNQTTDWMISAKFEIPAAVIKNRKAIHLHIEDVDGTEADFSDAP
ncbi:MAG TPA: hypothetical protein VGN17_21980 [Bryobacteraceae bacterium]